MKTRKSYRFVLLFICLWCLFGSSQAPTVIIANAAGPNDQPPTIWSNFFCNRWGNNGWCRVPSTLSVYARDPQFYVLTKFSVDRTNDAYTFACNAWVPECDLWQGEGVWSFNYTVTSSSGLSASGSTTTKVDATAPTAGIEVPTPTGSNGWFNTVPVNISVSGADELSGLAVARVSADGGVTWQSASLTLATDGEYAINYGAEDVAGNQVEYSGIPVRIDTTPPTITPAVSGTAGANGWYVSSVNVSASASDALSGVHGKVEVSLDHGSTWESLPIQITDDGNHPMLFRAFDVAGNEGTAALNVSIDTASPNLSFVLNGTPGANSWYVSDVQVSPNASDALSGLDQAEVSANGGGGTASSMTLSDGTYTLDAYAMDKAGNIKTISDNLRIDTDFPNSNYTSHTSNDVVSGLVKLVGLASDSSGVQSEEISLDGGVTWQVATLSNGEWSYDWNAAAIPDGPLTIYIRATDVAGNQEVPIPLVLVVENLPPQVTITKSWWIWQSGKFHVSSNTFAIRDITVKISDPHGRWPATTLSYDPDKTSAEVTWDRRFPGGVVAPMGDYQAEVTACDVNNNCASDKGTISIPIIAPMPPVITPTAAIPPNDTPTNAMIPSPMPTVTALVPAQAVVAKPSVTPAPSQVISENPVPKKSGFVSNPVWVLLILSLLILLFVIVDILDPRPKALRSLAKTLNQFNKE